MLLFNGYGSACMIAQRDPWMSASSFDQPSYLPIAHMIPPFPQIWISVSRKYWPLSPLVLGYLQIPLTPPLPQFYQISLPLVLGETIIDPFPVHFIQFTWVRLSHKHHTGSGWALPVCSWHSWCTIGTDTWSIFHPVTPGVAAWGCFLRSPFGATGPLGMYAVVSTLVLHLQLHWLTLEPLVEDGPVVQIIARWLLVIWLAALLAWGN